MIKPVITQKCSTAVNKNIELAINVPELGGIQPQTIKKSILTRLN